MHVRFDSLSRGSVSGQETSTPNHYKPLQLWLLQFETFVSSKMYFYQLKNYSSHEDNRANTHRVLAVISCCYYRHGQNLLRQIHWLME